MVGLEHPRWGVARRGSSRGARRWWAARWRRLLAGLFAGTLVAACQAGCRTTVGLEAADRARVHALLRGFTTREQLTDYLGGEPTTCVTSAPGRELCEWVLGNRNRAWHSLAQAIGTRDRVGVLCELPAPGGVREPESCTIHQRRSSRERWRAPTSSERRRSKRKLPTRSQLRDAAQALLDEARTLPAMSRLMGAAPDRCFAAGGREQTCAWYTNNHVYGHGILAASREEMMSRKMMLRCGFPLDGSPRAPDSCYVGRGP